MLTQVQVQQLTSDAICTTINTDAIVQQLTQMQVQQLTQMQVQLLTQCALYNN